MTMLGDFLVRSSQLVNGAINTAAAVVTAASETITVVGNFISYLTAMAAGYSRRRPSL
jgi:flagellar hook-associated protein FlgK